MWDSRSEFDYHTPVLAIDFNAMRGYDPKLIQGVRIFRVTNASQQQPYFFFIVC